MLESNFYFIKDKLPDLYKFAQVIEKINYFNVGASGVNIKFFIESALTCVYDNFNINHDISMSAFDRMNNKKFKHYVDKEIINSFNYLRVEANAMTHNDGYEPKSLVEIIKSVYIIVSWINKDYIELSADDYNKFFIPTHTQEIENFRNDITKFNLAEYLRERYKEKKEVDIEVIDFFLKKEIDINGNTNEGKYTPLMLAILLENNELVSLLIKNDADVNVLNAYGMNAFMLSVAMGNVEAIKELIEKRVDIHKKVIFNIDIKIDYFELLEKDQEAPDEPEFKLVELSAFAFCCNKYNTDVIRILIENGFDVNEPVIGTDKLALFLMDPMKYQNKYVRYNNRSSSYHNFAISYACTNNDVELVKLLISKGAKKFAENDLFLACKNLNLNLVEILIQAGAEVNPPNNSIIGLSPIHTLCAVSAIANFGDHSKLAENTNIASEKLFEIIKLLIDKGADINKNSTLMAACSFIDENFDGLGNDKGKNRFNGKVNPEVVQLLLDRGADVNYKDGNGKSTLMEICDSKINGYEIAKLLVDYGVDVNAKDNDGNTVLMYIKESEINYNDYAFAQNHPEDMSCKEIDILQSESIMQLLIKKGADVNARNKLGMTALMKHSYEGNTGLVGILLDNGAVITIKSELTALDLANDKFIKQMILDSKNNSPLDLVKILKSFALDKPIKYTTHRWDYGHLIKTYENFDGFMKAVEGQWSKFQEDLLKLSPDLHTIIYNFLFEEDIDKAIGWSSLKDKGLREHCNDGNEPFDFIYDKVGNVRFSQVIGKFKNKIEIRRDVEKLEEIFEKQRKKLGRKFEVDLLKLKGRSFYTDTHKFSNAIESIFDVIKDIGIKNGCKKIRVEIMEYEDEEFIDLRICHISSFSEIKDEELATEADGDDGDFSQIKNSLANLCDWSVQNVYDGKAYQVNYLWCENKKEVEPGEIKMPDGFTHILRIYR